MHLGNGAVTPECALIAAVAAGASAAVAWRLARAAQPDRNNIGTAAALGALVFAAQMFNLPIPPHSSAHLVGGVLLAWTLGPGLGVLCMASILLLQAALLGDGGLLTLGVNLLNMGVVPALLVGLIDRLGAKRSMVTLGAVAFASTVLGAVLIAAEVAVGRSAAELAGWQMFAQSMLGFHLAAGLLEAGATILVVQALRLIADAPASRWNLSGYQAAAVVSVSLAIAVLSMPTLGFASTAPDGYEAALLAAEGSTGNAISAIESAENHAGVAATVQHCQDRLVNAMPLPAIVIGPVGALVAGGAAAMFARMASRRFRDSRTNV